MRCKVSGRIGASAPTEAQQEVQWAGDRKGRPYESVTRGVRKESPRHGFAVTAPFRQGGLGTGDADCHSQCVHWLRNDTLLEIRYKPGGRIDASAPTFLLQIGKSKALRGWRALLFLFYSVYSAS